jgi:NAD(P)H-flavin reductase
MKKVIDFHNLEIVYSVKGFYTQRMAEELKPGRNVWIKLPYGDFIVEKHITVGQHAVFIAGGTGISPFVPYFHQVLESGSANPISIYYGIRDQKHYLYHDLLGKINTIVNVHITEGMFDIQAICNEIINLKYAVCFISGPPVMIQAYKKELENQGFPSDYIVIDAWE